MNNQHQYLKKRPAAAAAAASSSTSTSTSTNNTLRRIGGPTVDEFHSYLQAIAITVAGDDDNNIVLTESAILGLREIYFTFLSSVAEDLTQYDTIDFQNISTTILSNYPTMSTLLSDAKNEIDTEEEYNKQMKKNNKKKKAGSKDGDDTNVDVDNSSSTKKNNSRKRTAAAAAARSEGDSSG